MMAFRDSIFETSDHLLQYYDQHGQYPSKQALIHRFGSALTEVSEHGMTEFTTVLCHGMIDCAYIESHLRGSLYSAWPRELLLAVHHDSDAVSKAFDNAKSEGMTPFFENQVAMVHDKQGYGRTLSKVAAAMKWTDYGEWTEEFRKKVDQESAELNE